MSDPSQHRWRLAANVSDSPVIVDDAGHTLGGGEYGAADTTSTAVDDAIARRVLVWPDKPSRHADTPAGRAQRDVEARNRRKSENDAQEG